MCRVQGTPAINQAVSILTSGHTIGFGGELEETLLENV